MGWHPVAVVILHITYARTMRVDYSRFSWGVNMGSLEELQKSQDGTQSWQLAYHPRFHLGLQRYREVKLLGL
jgi:hypothetical protein